MTFFVEQGDTRIPITPLDADQTVEDFYGYRENGHPHSHTPSHIERDNVSELFLWKEPTGETTLGIIHDDRYDSGGGDVTFEFSGLADSAEWVVRDDDSGNDSYFGLSRAEWHWGSNHTDGGAIRNLTASDSSVPFANDLSIQIDGTGEKVPLSNDWHYTKRYENQTIEGLEPPIYVIVFADNAPFDSHVPSGHPQQGYNLDGDEIIPKVTDSGYQDDLYLVMQPRSESTTLKFVAATSANNNSLWYGDKELIPDSKAAAEGTAFELPAFEDPLVTITPTFKNGINDWQVLSGDVDNPDRHSLDMTKPITISSGGGEISRTLTTLSFFPGLNEDSSGGGDELNSVLPHVSDTYPLIDDWFHGDNKRKLESSLNDAIKADKELEEFPGEKFKSYRFKNLIDISFDTRTDGTINRDSLSVKVNGVGSDNGGEDVIEESPVFITLEGEDNLLRENNGFFDNDLKKRATRRERFTKVSDEPIQVDGKEAIRVSTVLGAFDPYVETLLEVYADKGLIGLSTLLSGIPIGVIVGLIAAYISTTPSIYTWIDLTVFEDGTSLGRVVDASVFPRHAGYIDDTKLAHTPFDQGDEWKAKEKSNDMFEGWVEEAQKPGLVPYQKPMLAYEQMYNWGEGPHPVMTFGTDKDGNELTNKEVKKIEEKLLAADGVHFPS